MNKTLIIICFLITSCSHRVIEKEPKQNISLKCLSAVSEQVQIEISNISSDTLILDDKLGTREFPVFIKTPLGAEIRINYINMDRINPWVITPNKLDTILIPFESLQPERHGQGVYEVAIGIPIIKKLNKSCLVDIK